MNGGAQLESVGHPVEPVARRALGHSAVSQQMMELLPFSVMRTDADLVIRYLNPAALRTLKQLEHSSSCRVEQIVGQTLDFLQQNPAPQSRIPHNPASLPYAADLSLGDETVHLVLTHTMTGDRNISAQS